MFWSTVASFGAARLGAAPTTRRPPKTSQCQGLALSACNDRRAAASFNDRDVRNTDRHGFTM